MIALAARMPGAESDCHGALFRRVTPFTLQPRLAIARAFLRANLRFIIEVPFTLPTLRALPIIRGAICLKARLRLSYRLIHVTLRYEALYDRTVRHVKHSMIILCLRSSAN